MLVKKAICPFSVSLNELHIKHIKLTLSLQVQPAVSGAWSVFCVVMLMSRCVCPARVTEMTANIEQLGNV